MSVIAQLQISASSFELGRILGLERGATIELDDLIPLGERAVPFFTVHDSTREAFEADVQRHPSVQNIQKVSEHGDETVYALDWDVSRDHFFQAMLKTDAHLLSGTGSTSDWAFEIRFPTHDDLSTFQEQCSDANIGLDVQRIYNPAKPGTGRWYGLSDAQRNTLVRAVEGGYYSIPRRMSTQDLADAFDISDQAVTERLRRAIITLVENSLITAMEEDGPDPFE